MKKKADEQAIMSELRRGSVFFPPAAETAEAAAPDATEPVDRPVTMANAPAAGASLPEPPPVDRPALRTEGRRKKKRHPFEFYEDQLSTLKQWSLEEQLQGGEGSMSEMVREAVDAYIAKRRDGTP